MKQQLDLEVKKFFDLLANTPSIKVKKQLLAEKRDDGNIKKFLDYLLNPFFVTGISEKKIRKVVSVEKSVHFHSAGYRQILKCKQQFSRKGDVRCFF